MYDVFLICEDLQRQITASFSYNTSYLCTILTARPRCFSQPTESFIILVGSAILNFLSAVKAAVMAGTAVMSRWILHWLNGCGQEKANNYGQIQHLPYVLELDW